MLVGYMRQLSDNMVYAMAYHTKKLEEESSAEKAL
jgi:hypothetical protein